MRHLLVLCSTLILSGCGAASPPSAAAQTASLDDLSAAMQAVSAEVGDAIVYIVASGYAAGSGEGGDVASLLSARQESGSGVLLSADGYIVTNAHVVAGARRVDILLPLSDEQRDAYQSILPPRGAFEQARIVGVDAETDLALLHVERDGLPFLELGDSDSLRTGEIVLAFGSPFGLQGTVTMGVVSSVARQVEAESPMVYIQTDAPINPGNSGGPLVNGRGEVIGINTFIVSPSGASAGIGFAVPSNIVATIYEQLRATGRVRRGLIGVHAQTITPALAIGLGLSQGWGVLVGDVTPHGPAARAGLRTGDIVVRLAGRVMENARQFDVNLYRYRLGDVVRVDVLRGEEPFTFEVEVVERPDDPARFSTLVEPDENVIDDLGILALELDERVSAMLPDLRAASGVVVAAAQRAGLPSSGVLEPGDVILSVNRRLTPNIAELRRALARIDPFEPIALQVERRGQTRFVAIER